MNKLAESWFTEFSPDDLAKLENKDSDDKCLKSDGVSMGGAWPGQAFSLQIKEVLFKGRSKFQDVLVFESATYGNVLVLDGIIQATERDEFAYQEMLAHLPLFAHPNPEKVLIIGGGDGGILREVLKHKSVQSVVMCEIDEMVIDVSKKYLPGMASGFSDPKLNLFIGDGFEFLKAHKNEFDVIITDSSDPVGPAESLFSENYYSLLNDSLKADGILSSQGECPWLDAQLIANLCKFCKKLFPTTAYGLSSVPTYTTGLMGECMWLHKQLINHIVRFNRRIFEIVEYGSAAVPTYPSGSMGYLICSKKYDVKVPARVVTDEEVDQMNLRFYNSSVHSACFALPTFLRKALEE